MPPTVSTHMIPGPFLNPLAQAMRDEDAIADTLSDLAGLDTFDIDLPRHPKAWAIMEKLVKVIRGEAAAPVPSEQPVAITTLLDPERQKATTQEWLKERGLR